VTKPTLIIYQAGAYGTFIEWLLSYLTDKTLDDQMPFGRNGNAHNFYGGNHFTPDGKNFYKNPAPDKKISFTRCHINMFTAEQENSKFSSVISIDVPHTSTLWILRNSIEKIEVADCQDEEIIESIVKYNPGLIERQKKYVGNKRDYRWVSVLREYLTQTETTAYNLDNIEDLKRWQLREIFSYWNIPDTLGVWPDSKHENNYRISVEDLRDQMPAVINDLIEKLELEVIPSRYEKLEYIYQQWKSKQKHTNIDEIVNKYINNVINDVDETVEVSFNLCEEVIIQQKLRQAGYEIKCDGLDRLPLRTIDLKSLLYNV
jgi:hypothetical protein